MDRNAILKQDQCALHQMEQIYSLGHIVFLLTIKHAIKI